MHKPCCALNLLNSLLDLCTCYLLYFHFLSYPTSNPSASPDMIPSKAAQLLLFAFTTSTWEQVTIISYTSSGFLPQLLSCFYSCPPSACSQHKSLVMLLLCSKPSIGSQLRLKAQTLTMASTVLVMWPLSSLTSPLAILRLSHFAPGSLNPPNTLLPLDLYTCWFFCLKYSSFR